MSKRSLNVGIVGVGHIGAPLLVHLAFKSRNSMYLQIHSRSLAKAQSIADKLHRDGCQSALRVHDRYSTMTKWCDVIITCLGTEAAARSVLLNTEDALIPNARRGQIILDHSSTTVQLARKCFHEATKRGAHYIDAPLAGSISHAENAQLTVLAGGEEESFNKVVSMMRLYAENVHHMGPPGAGSASKSISEALVAIHTVAAAEAVTLAHEFGVRNIEKLTRVLDTTQASSAMLRKCGPTMQDMIRDPDNIPPKKQESVDRMLHALSTLHNSVKSDVQLPLLSTSRRVFAQAGQAGIGNRDMASVVHFLNVDQSPSNARQVKKSEAKPAVPTATSTPAAEAAEFY